MALPIPTTSKAWVMCASHLRRKVRRVEGRFRAGQARGAAAARTAPPSPARCPAVRGRRRTAAGRRKDRDLRFRRSFYAELAPRLPGSGRIFFFSLPQTDILPQGLSEGGRTETARRGGCHGPRPLWHAGTPLP